MDAVLTDCSKCHSGDSIFAGPVIFYDHSQHPAQLSQQSVPSEETDSPSSQPLCSRDQICKLWARRRRGLGAGLVLFTLLLGIITYFIWNEPAVKELIPEPWLVGREAWGAQKPLTYKNFRNSTPFQMVVIIHTGGRECRSLSDCSKVIFRLQGLHQIEYRYDDIAYNFLVGSDGRVYEGRGFNYTGGHTNSCNSFCLGIAFIGDYRSLFGNAHPSTQQVNATLQLIKQAENEGHLKRGSPVVAQCHAIKQESPGDNIYCPMHSWPNFINVNFTIHDQPLTGKCPYLCGGSAIKSQVTYISLSMLIFCSLNVNWVLS